MLGIQALNPIYGFKTAISYYSYCQNNIPFHVKSGTSIFS